MICKSLIGGIAMFGAALAEPLPAPEDYALTPVNILAMDCDCVLENQTLLLSGGRIAGIGPAASTEIPDSYREVDGMGRFVIPGLGDMHVHFRDADETVLRNYLRAGITLVREMNGRPFLLKWRDEINEGERLGPQMFVASPTIANRSSPSEGFPTPETPAEARMRIKEFADAGYDLVKVYSFLAPDIFFAIMEAGREFGIEIAGHIPVAVSLEEALGAGFRSNEHLTAYFDAVATEEGVALDAEDYRGIFFAAPIDDEKLARAVAATVDADMWNAPTIMWFTKNNANRRARDAWSDPALRKLGEANRLRVLKALHDGGAKLLAATDSDDGDQLYASALYEELALAVDAGLTPYEALRMSTTAPAEYLGLDDVGLVKPGYQADVAALACNPLTNIRCLQYIEWVFVDGRYVE